MSRALLVLLYLLPWMTPCHAQLDQIGSAPFILTGNIPISANSEKAMVQMMEAWKHEMAKEPGAKVRVTAADELTGSARFPYRSKPLALREETHGVIMYRITFRMSDGICRYIVNDMRHQGNSSTRIGGMHFGPLGVGDLPERNVPGMSRRNTEKIYADMKAQIREHLREVIVGIRQHLEESAAR